MSERILWAMQLVAGDKWEDIAVPSSSGLASWCARMAELKLNGTYRVLTSERRFLIVQVTSHTEYKYDVRDIV